ncbi:MAG: hypothetical protein B5M53_00415 [Candidatus Cloacimonas sp. 4484_209]|nr:MAG: hypothetical protein B5M53_00415 [Candidatus Cloacimonas sp. 4484_209]
MKKKIIVLLIVCIFLFPIVLGSNDWPMFQKDLQNTGYYACKMTDQLELLWKYRTGEEDTHCSSVAKGKIYVCTSKSTYCLDADTGEEIWNCDIGIITYFSSPLIVNGRVYVNSEDALYCLDAGNGSELWHCDIEHLSSPTMFNNKIYLGSGDGDIYCLDADTGDTQWKYQAGGCIEFSLAVANGKIYTGSYDHKIYCLDANTGEKLWDYDTYMDVYLSTFYEEKAYFGSKEEVICLDADTGKRIWGYRTGCDVAAPSIANGKAYVSTDCGFISCLDANTGKRIWRRGFGSYLTLPALTKEKVYVGCRSSGDIYCLDADTGREIWSYHTGPPSFSLVISDEKLYVGTEEGIVYCFGSKETSSKVPNILPYLIIIAIVVILVFSIYTITKRKSKEETIRRKPIEQEMEHKVKEKYSEEKVSPRMNYLLKEKEDLRKKLGELKSEKNRLISQKIMTEGEYEKKYEEIMDKLVDIEDKIIQEKIKGGKKK